ncbi:MAG TPA: GGDEF domain-containing protein [Cellvibrio sp.]|nr:GGDEF domain-containing protein [Cellvibrio sp.]
MTKEIEEKSDVPPEEVAAQEIVVSPERSVAVQQELLERALMRVSISVEGQDDTLDFLLRQLRESLQNPISGDINAVIDRFHEAEHNIKQNLEDNLQAVRQALIETIQQLQQFDLSPGLNDAIYRFLSQLPQSSKKVYSYPDLLQQLADIQKQALYEIKHPGGLWKKLMGHGQKSASPAIHDNLLRCVNDLQQSLAQATNFEQLQAKVHFLIGNIQHLLNNDSPHVNQQDNAEKKQHNPAVPQPKNLQDPLTGLPNREAYLERLAHEFHRWRRYGRPITLAVFTIDHIQYINSHYGQQAGDKILKVIAGSVANRLREVDFLGSIDGDKFVLLMPETTLKNSLFLLEKLRTAIARASFNYQQQAISTSLSIAATDFKDGDTMESAFARADELLQKAMLEGINSLNTL